MPRAHGYIRVSTDDQVDSGLSLEHQRGVVRREYEYRWKDKGYEWNRVYEDAAQSGRKPLTSRPAGFKLSMEIEPGDVVIFPKLDRGFRNAEDMLQTTRVWGERGIRCVFLDLQVDSSSPTGRLVLGNLALVAEWERARIQERIKDAMRIARSRGMLAKPPFGCRVVGSKKERTRRYAIDPGPHALGRKIVEWKLAGHGWDEIVLHLRREGLDRPPPKRNRKAGRRLWTRGSVQRAYAATIKVLAWIEQGRVEKPKEKEQVDGQEEAHHVGRGGAEQPPTP